MKLIVTRMPFPIALCTDGGLHVLSQGLKNERAELAWNGPRAILGQTDAIVGHHNLVMVFVTLQALNRDDAALAAGEGILECIGEQFVDEGTDRHRDVDRSGSVVDLEVESNSAQPVSVHDARCDLTDVVSEIDHLTQLPGGARI